MKVAAILVLTGASAMAFGVLALLGAIAGEAVGLGQGFGLVVSVGCCAVFVAGLRIAEGVIKSRMEDAEP
jgi:hypothetical protein